jgi:uncharacterized protein YecT (DUF1311 family)
MNLILTKKLFLGCIFYITLSANCAAFKDKTIVDCEKRYDTADELSRCLDIVKEAIDRELQTWINNQVFILEEFSLSTGRTSSLTMFKRSQRNFISYRENNCRWQYLHLSPNKMAASAFKKCYILTTFDRIEELSRLNE